MSSKNKAVLENSKIAITAVGGDGDAVAAMIESGDWSQYFRSSAELSQAVPLSYTFTKLGDGSIAAVTEATEYNINALVRRRGRLRSRECRGVVDKLGIILYLYGR